MYCVFGDEGLDFDNKAICVAKEIAKGTGKYHRKLRVLMC
jgi:hypothetical protein